MRFIIVALALMAMFSTASAQDSGDEVNVGSTYEDFALGSTSRYNYWKKETDCHYYTMENGNQCLASGFELIAEDVQCDWNDLDKVARSTLGGGDHGESGCYRECEIRGDNCNFYAYKESTGYCHMFKTCYKQTTNDGYKLYRKKPIYYECTDGAGESGAVLEDSSYTSFHTCGRECIENSECVGYDYLPLCVRDNCCRLYDRNTPREASETSGNREWCICIDNPNPTSTQSCSDIFATAGITQFDTDACQGRLMEEFDSDTYSGTELELIDFCAYSCGVCGINDDDIHDVYTCTSGQGKSESSIKELNLPDKAKCANACIAKENCIAFDYCDKSKSSACRLYKIDEPRSDAGSDDRLYCVEKTNTASFEAVGDTERTLSSLSETGSGGTGDKFNFNFYNGLLSGIFCISFLYCVRNHVWFKNGAENQPLLSDVEE